MRVLLFYPLFRDVDPKTSVNKKCTELINAFHELKDIELDTVLLDSKHCYYNDKIIATFPSNKVLKWLFINTTLYNVIGKEIVKKKHDFFWVRAPLLSPFLTGMLKRMKKQNPAIKMTLEFGSYPYIKEYTGVKRLIFQIDVLTAPMLKASIDKIITYCEQERIYNIDTIQLSNGVEVAAIPFSVQEQNTKALQLVSVSSIFYWHGIDRVLRGMASYYKHPNTKEVYFTVVGRGADLDNLKNLAGELNLEKYVQFTGEKIGKDLDSVFASADLGIGTLGMHRKNLTADSSLKNREYSARGLPFILATRDKDYLPGFEFVKYVPGDDSEVNIHELIAFYDQLKSTHPDYRQEIRQYAKDKLDWTVKIKQVLSEV